MMDNKREHKIILCIARRELGPIQRAELRRLLQEPLDFDYLFTIAQAHGLLPLLHKNINSAADLVPGHFLSRLKRESVANSQNVLHLIGKQLRVYKLLYEHDIPVAVFKGPVLAKMAYGEISLRQAGDIDMLIKLQHFDKARRCLESLGYEMFPRLTWAQLGSHLKNHCEIQFVRDDWFTVIDLHWDLAPRSFVFKIEIDELLSRLQVVCMPGTLVQTFGPEDSVLYQSMHGAKHLWRRLEWITSLAETLRASLEIDWELLVDRAVRAHATRMLGLGLRLVEKFSDVDVPVEVLAPLDPDGAMYRLAQELGERIFTTYGYADSTETNLFNFRVMDRKRDVLSSALRAIFVPTFPDWQGVALPLHALYYAYRPWRLSKIYTTSFLRKVRGVGD